MKVVEIIPSFHPPGGAQTFVSSLIKAFRKLDNVSLEVVSLYDKKGFINEELEKADIRIHYLNKKTGVDFHTSNQLRRLIYKIKPDIIHIHIASVNTLFLSGLLKRRAPYSVFYTIHSIASKDARIIPSAILKCMFHRQIITPISISPEVSKTVKEKYNLSVHPVIYNGIDVMKFSCNTDLKNRLNDFIHVGSFSEVKNHLFLIESFAELVKTHPTAKLTLVGDGPLLETAKEKASTLGVNGNIAFMGMRRDVSTLLQSHKFFLLPSLYEGNPISILEAMAAGLVVIASKTGGIIDIIDTKRNGYLFEINDKWGFVKLMSNAIESLDDQRLISKNNMNDSLRYDIDATAREHYELFESKKSVFRW
ncbi:MAG: glycosyltransferase family 4 protein [Erysipelotrichia bacterium]|jgi:glycosyltransferase involved in cell wall biosynthesis|nr:glycosyltransferase family 4 protein [Erysipelotrichia bacterium]